MEYIVSKYPKSRAFFRFFRDTLYPLDDFEYDDGDNDNDEDIILYHNLLILEYKIHASQCFNTYIVNNSYQ